MHLVESGSMYAYVDLVGSARNEGGSGTFLMDQASGFDDAAIFEVGYILLGMYVCKWAALLFSISTGFMEIAEFLE